ncbi:MAG TPA: hypothetical protein VK967_00140 [Methylotenera sp.]|nr:hypothetical protein [Methylotenera sp.]
MNTTKIIGITLLILGGLGLVYGGFSYTKDSTTAKIGPIELKIQENERVDIPLWGSIAALALGGILLISDRRN